jgi:F-type H+-transporting ATPase subunit alpha
MEIFTQFASDLDESTQNQLSYGKGLMELLKQPLNHPMTMPQQVITLVTATEKLFVNLPVEQVKKAQGAMLEYFASHAPAVERELDEKKVLTDELREKIISVAKDFFANPMLLK